MNKPDFLDTCFAANVCPTPALKNAGVQNFLKGDTGKLSNVISQITLRTILNEQFN